MTDWYVCFKSDIKTVCCIGPFNQTLDADYRSNIKDTTLIGVCKYMPKFMAKRRIINLYNSYCDCIFEHQFVFKPAQWDNIEPLN